MGIEKFIQEKVLDRVAEEHPVFNAVKDVINGAPLPVELLEKHDENWFDKPEAIRSAMEQDILELQRMINENTDRDVEAEILQSNDLRKAIENMPVWDVWDMVFTWYEDEKNKMYANIEEELKAANNG